MDRVEALCDALRSRQERVTRARRAVIEVLVGSGAHLTAEEIHARVEAVAPDVHRATVYRALETLSRLELVEHAHLGHGPAVYHLSDDLHHHLVCEVCGAVIEVPASLFEDAERRVREEFGFEARSHHFAVVGRCRGCAG
jgi:Fur family transcriptional regulator, ferric uptake regulator